MFVAGANAAGARPHPAELVEGPRVGRQDRVGGSRRQSSFAPGKPDGQDSFQLVKFNPAYTPAPACRSSSRSAPRSRSGDADALGRVVCFDRDAEWLEPRGQRRRATRPCGRGRDLRGVARPRRVLEQHQERAVAPEHDRARGGDDDATAPSGPGGRPVDRADRRPGRVHGRGEPRRICSASATCSTSTRRPGRRRRTRRSAH